MITGITRNTELRRPSARSGGRSKVARSQIVANAQVAPPGAEGKLEAAQAFIREGRAAEMQRGEAVGPSVSFNRFPHQQIGWTKVLEGAVGGAELIHGMTAKLKEDRAGYNPALPTSLNYPTEPGGH